MSMSKIDPAALEKLAAASSPEEVQAALDSLGLKLESGAPGPDKSKADGKPPGEKAPPFGKPKDEGSPPAPGGKSDPFSSPPDESYSSARDRAIKKSKQDEGMDF